MRRGAQDLAAVTTLDVVSGGRAVLGAGADGMIVACPDDPVRITAIGQVLAESFPG